MPHGAPTLAGGFNSTIGLYTGLVIILGILSSSESIAQPPSLSLESSVHGASFRDVAVPQPIEFSSWRACVDSAEASRSKRDLEFFLKAPRLSNARQWFVSHSYTNEKRFCAEVAACEMTFSEAYANAIDSSYPPCDQPQVRD